MPLSTAIAVNLSITNKLGTGSLTEETITTLNKMKGFYENWKDEWFAAGDLLDKLGKDEDN
jgi:hypothetical protein